QQCLGLSRPWNANVAQARQVDCGAVQESYRSARAPRHKAATTDDAHAERGEVQYRYQMLWRIQCAPSSALLFRQQLPINDWRIASTTNPVALMKGSDTTQEKFFLYRYLQTSHP